MTYNYSLIYKYLKAQIGMQVARKISGKKRSLRGINEPFGRLDLCCTQDAPNMGFCGKGGE